jgi:hypothetical protein
MLYIELNICVSLKVLDFTYIDVWTQLNDICQIT